MEQRKTGHPGRGFNTLRFREIIFSAEVSKMRPQAKKIESAAQIKRPWLSIDRGDGRVIKAL